MDESGASVDEAYKASRAEKLLSTYRDLSPDIVLTEAYPFGRRQVHFELRPLLDAITKDKEAGRRVHVFASIRDLLQEGRKPGRDQETAEIINAFYDGVLVHGDPVLSTLADTFPLVDTLTVPIIDTGLIAPQLAEIRPTPDTPFGVIASAGGGAVGQRVLHATAELAATGYFGPQRVALVTGPNMPKADVEALKAITVDRAELVPFIAELPTALAKANLSISQAGYNTVADILVAGTVSVLVPFATGGETEQTRRAVALSARQRAIHLPEDALSPATLAEACDNAHALPRPYATFNIDGAAATAQHLSSVIARQM